MIDGKKCIGILTSGGDSPGMNAAIRSIVRTAINRDIVPLGVSRGYNGLLNKNFQVMTAKSVSNILKRGGTILLTARCMEFHEEKYQKIAYENCLEAGMDGLIVIGGDGSYNGAKKLSNLGLPCIGIPGTIDNDIACTEYTIGYDTAMNTVVEMVDKLNDTSQSHHRCSVVEVMGRHAGHVALNTGIACGAIQIITEEVPVSVEEVAERILEAKKRGKQHYIIIVSEGVGNAENIAKEIKAITGIESRSSVLGHVQRGGAPTLRDRVTASAMGSQAVDLLEKGTGNRVLAIKNGQIVDLDIQEALEMQKGLDMNLYNVMREIGY